MATKQLPHPALERFNGWADPDARLLLVRAAPGTGRSWFAASWIGARRGEVHDYTNKPFEQLNGLGALIARMATDPQLHCAVILSPDHTVWHLGLKTHLAFAEQADLLLQSDEISRILPAGLHDGPERADSIFQLCGGWLRAAQILVNDQFAVESARQQLRVGLASWLAYRDPSTELSGIAHLAYYDEETIEEFYAQLTSSAHGLDELLRCGILQREAGAGIMMPTLVRQLLMERIQSSGPGLRKNYESAAFNSVIKRRGIQETADLLIAHKWWSALGRLVSQHWDEAFLLDPVWLRVLINRLPAAALTRNRSLRIGLWILERLFSDSMDSPVPHMLTGYRPGSVVQQLHHQASQLATSPGPEAVSAGLLEMLYLRYNALHEAAADSARNLDRVLRQAVSQGLLRDTMASLAFFQIGNCLFLAGDETGAQQAFERSLAAARPTGNAFLAAAALGKLALVHSLNGYRSVAREYLEEFEKHVPHVTWGKSAVLRPGILSHAYLAMGDLDMRRTREELSRLGSIGTDEELPAVQTYIKAMESIGEGSPSVASKLVFRVRQERPVVSSSPLARKLLDDVLATVSVIDRTALPPELDLENIDPTLLALKFILDRQSDAALAMLDEIDRGTHLRNGGNLVHYLKVVVRHPEAPTDVQLAKLKKLHHASGSLYELSLLQMIPGWGDLASQMELDEWQMERLGDVWQNVDAHAPERPKLTPRELEILAHLRSGMRRKEIARRTFRSENTIKSQIKSLYKKLDASSLGEMLENARRSGL